LSDFIYKYRDWLTLGLCVVLSVIILNGNDNPQMMILRTKVSSAAGFIASPFRFIPRTVRLYRENKELNRALFVLNQENSRLKELEAENIRLRQMLNFVNEMALDYIPALVVGRSAGISLNSITIDKGRKHNLEPGNPVVSSKGLVGRLVSVDKDRSLCQLMLDNTFGAAVKVKRNRIDGILHWEGGDLCRLDGIPATMDVRRGDVLITSGLGGVFQKGLNVGSVVKVRIEHGELFQEILVEPFTDFHRLEEVFVLIP